MEHPTASGRKYERRHRGRRQGASHAPVATLAGACFPDHAHQSPCLRRRRRGLRHGLAMAEVEAGDVEPVEELDALGEALL